ncbi:GOLPH3/VPS74 family protein [Catellatospora sichuanensis]|uniref:GOLPH3/VPS74 family protein n=1 Tax=Catellatospora sichuanensis TaxID=1969805 RepID=UPI0011833682|nr:GPP34 family phosphoprotein [Catellatospora sichuanensis]
MPIADEFYLMTHDDVSGDSRLHAKAVGFGLAAALLAELCMLDLVRPAVEGVAVRNAPPPADALVARVHGQLLAEPQLHPVRDWLAFLGRTAEADIAVRMTATGALQLVETRRLLGVQRRYMPVSVNDAAWPTARIIGRLRRQEEMSVEDRILAGLTFATGLSNTFAWDDVRGRALSLVIAALDEPLRILIAETELAVSKAVGTLT